MSTLDDSARIATELVDLSEVPLSRFRFDSSDVLSRSTWRIVAQTARPRANIGNTGPPGRAD
jgi:hypothetical protein